MTAFIRRLMGRSAAAVAVGFALAPGSAFGWHGPPPVTIQPGSNLILETQIATDRNGGAVAVWIQIENDLRILRSSIRRPGGEWSDPITISGAGQNAELPDLAMGRDGTAVVAWHHWNGLVSTIEAVIRLPNAAWSSPQALSAPTTNAYAARVAVDDSGSATAVWAGAAGGPAVIESSFRMAGGSWSAPQAISQPGAYKPSVAVNGSGNAVAAWLEWDGAHRVVRASIRVGGAWSPGEPLSAPGQNSEAAEVAIDNSANAHSVWMRGDRRGLEVQRSYRPNAGQWELPRNFLIGRRPQIEVGGAGHAVAAWTRSHTTMVALKPPGGPWGGSEPTLFGARGPNIAVDDEGNVVVVTTSFGPRAAWKPVGAPWLEPFDLSPGGGGDFPDVEMDRPGNATAVWVDEGRVRASSFDIASGQEADEDFIDGTEGDDELVGDEDDEVFRTYGGNDVVHSGGGNDVVYAGRGRDTVFGGLGNDKIYGGKGSDRLLGGPGRDRLFGGPSRDRLLGERGRDVIYADDGTRDAVVGGGSRDWYRVDRRLDRIETVEDPF